MDLSEAIDFTCNFKYTICNNRNIEEEIRELLFELQERRESELKSANKFFGIGPYEQFKHYTSESHEVDVAFCLWFYLKKQAETIKQWEEYLNKYKDDLAMEIVDKQMSGETLLAELGYDEQQRRELRKKVIVKNNERGYYDDPE